MAHLQLDSVSKIFDDGGRRVEAVCPLTLGVERGQIVTFLGPSGCGKTTLMRMVGGLETPTSGRITLNGSELAGPDRRRGMVFQSYAAFPWLTVAGNIRLGVKYRRDLSSDAREATVQRLLTLVGLEGFDHSYINRISGGMRQRVAIARTLAADPEVLLMDEPFGALDALTREHLQIKLLDINRAAAKTTIFVTHDVEEAILLAHRVLVFSARPARVLEDLDVTARLGPGDRTRALRDTPAFLELKRHVQSIIRDEYMRAEPGVVADAG
ncbi:MAG: ABC transporter ATP-binding protein [Pseudomonadota bacterium]